MRRAIVFLVAVTLFGARLVAAEESLADAAAREKARRKGQSGGKVITEADLGRAAGRTVSTPEGGASTAPAASDDKKPAEKRGAPAEKTEAELRADKEKEWRTRRDAAAAEVTRLQDVVSQLQQSINQYSSPLLQNHLAEA